ncbi:hypothetical protein [Sandaracinus amylolyticus]|uniref:hypothetical protein n=1 Tax=Sandaracinus amylolyticus TaxID=927083 RepID=UPI001F397B77|nr:hypothetical protein [Sandaracinus amylolyticus]UJR86065.1 Hypothetical protein I5071_81460 [Sandaracinus amylolyticus]
MLETLEDSVFATLEDAYGPAVDVPDRLRALAHGTYDEARHALGDLVAGIFHQGSYYQAAAPAIPFLIEIADGDVPIRAALLHVLADMSAPLPEPEAFDPYLFHSTPGAPEYPEAIATIDAIRKGIAVYERALEAARPEVRRAAARLVACVRGEGARVPIEAAIARETDTLTQVALAFAARDVGASLPEPEGPGLLADVVSMLRDGPLDDARAAALERLLLSAPLDIDESPLNGLIRAATRALERCATDPRAFEVLERALEARLARGEQIREHTGPTTERVCDEGTRPRFDPRALVADAPLRLLAGAMAHVAFGERGHRPPLLRREELDARMRRVLALSSDHRIPLPLPAAPWFGPGEMARFLRGAGALDHEVEIDGVRAPAYELLHAIAQAPGEPSTAARVDAIIAALVQDVDAFELALDVLERPYALPAHGHLAQHLERAIEAHVVPRLAGQRARFDAYARTLAARESIDPAAARFALTRGEAVAPELERVARSAIASIAGTAEADALAWLRAFPEPRRAALVATMGNAWLLHKLEPACDPDALSRALLDRFLAPDCDWMVHEADRLLATVPIELLASARVAGRRATILRRVLRDRTGEGLFVLDLRADGDAVRATLRDHAATILVARSLSAQPMPDELRAFADAVKHVVQPRIELDGDLDHTTRYRVQRLFGELGFRGEIADGNSTLYVG